MNQDYCYFNNYNLLFDQLYLLVSNPILSWNIYRWPYWFFYCDFIYKSFKIILEKNNNCYLWFNYHFFHSFFLCFGRWCLFLCDLFRRIIIWLKDLVRRYWKCSLWSLYNSYYFIISWLLDPLPYETLDFYFIFFSIHIHRHIFYY